MRGLLDLGSDSDDSNKEGQESGQEQRRQAPAAAVLLAGAVPKSTPCGKGKSKRRARLPPTKQGSSLVKKSRGMYSSSE